MTYQPPLIRQLGSGPFGSTNCTLASASVAILDHNAGQKPLSAKLWPPNPRKLRELSGDTEGGTNLGQAKFLASAFYGTDLDVRYRIPFEDMWAEGIAGKGVILQGGYGAIKDPFRGSESFQDNHAIPLIRFGQTIGLSLDPLYDGRRPGIPDGPRWVPKGQLRAFAGTLRMDAKGRTLGLGLCYAAFFDAEVSLPAPPVQIELGGNSLLITTPGDITTKKRKAVKKGTPIHREPGGAVITRMSRDARIPYLGYAGSVDGIGWQSVLIGTSNFPDGVSRTVGAYVRFDAGPVS